MRLCLTDAVTGQCVELNLAGVRLMNDVAERLGLGRPLPGWNDPVRLDLRPLGNAVLEELGRDRLELAAFAIEAAERIVRRPLYDRDPERQAAWLESHAREFARMGEAWAS